MLGIIFLSNYGLLEIVTLVSGFPSPYWGLFFYHRKTFKETWAVAVAVSVPVLGIIFYLHRILQNTPTFLLHCFRPRTGDYFFIVELYPIEFESTERAVSVPALGIIFLSC